VRLHPSQLNPVRAEVVTAERLDQFAPSRLSAWLSGSAPGFPMGSGRSAFESYPNLSVTDCRALR
jgi:hypothetical protein